MMATVHVAQIFAIDVRVDLGRRNVDVTQQLLNGGQIGPTLEQMRGKRVPQGVRGDAALNACATGGYLHEIPDTLPTDRLAARIQEDMPGAATTIELTPHPRQIAAQCAHGRAADGHKALFATLAEDQKQTLVEIEVRHGESGKL
jgi:hypothetical protein